MMNPSSPPPSSSTTYQQHQQQQHQQPPRPSASPYHHPQHHHHQLPPPPPQQQHSPVNGYHHLPPHQQMQQHHPMEASGYHHHVDYHEAWRREQHQHRVLEEREREREREHHEAQRHAGHPVHYRQDGYDAAAYQHQPPHHAHAAHHPQLPSPPGRGHSRTQSRDTFLPPPLPPVRDDRQSPAMRFEPLKQRRSPSSGDWRDGREAQQQQHKRKRSGAYDQYGPGAWDHHQTYPPGYDYRAHAAAAAAEEEYYYHQHQRQQQEAAAAAAQHQQQQHRQALREREREGDRHHERERDSARPSAPPVQKAHRRTASVEQRKGGNKLPPPVSPSVMGAHAPPPPHHMASPYDAPQMLPHGRPATHEEMAMYEHSQMYGQHPPPPPPAHPQATANGSRHHDARRRHEHPQAHHELHHAPAINGNGGYDDRHHRAPPSASAAAAAAAAMPPPPPPASHSHPEMVAAHGHGHGHDSHAMVAEPPAAMLPPPGAAAAAGAHPAHMRHPHQHPQHPPQQHPMAPPIHQLQRHRVISDGVWHWLEENEAASTSNSSKDASSAPPATRIAGSFIYSPWATPLLPADLIVRNVGSLLEVRVPGHLLGAYREKSDARAREGWTLGWRARQHGCRVDLGEGAKVVSESKGAGGGATAFWANRGLAERKVWGSEVYTDDSDVLGMCVHAGWIEGPTRLPSNNEGERPPQPNGVAHSSDAATTPLYSPPDIRVLLRIAPRLIGYRESYAGGLWSRNWLGMHDGLSLVVEEVALEPSGWAKKAKLPGARGVKSEAGRLGVLQRKVERLGEMEEDEEVTGVVVDEQGKASAAGVGGGGGDRTASLFSLLTRSDSSLRKTVFPLSEVRTMAMQGKGKGGDDATATGAAKKQQQHHGKEWYRLNQVVTMRG